MANVMFKKGLQSGFDALTSYTAGAFYLTTDTNRLYFADTTSKANYLNKYVHTVATESALNTAITNGEVVTGDFVYVSGVNALVAVDTSKTQKYIQINAYENDNDDTKTTALTFSKSVNDDNNDITISYTLKQSTKNINGGSTAQPDITGSFVISGNDINAIIPAAAVEVGATVAANKATVKTSGTGSAGAGFTISGSGSVSVGGANNAVTIEGTDTTYTLSSPANQAKVAITGSDGGSSSVEVTAGKQISVSGADAGKIQVAHSEITTTPKTTNEELTDKGSFEVIDSLTIDNGHITGYNTNTVKIPELPKYEITAVSADTAGKINVTLKETVTGATKTTSSAADLYYMVNGSKVANGGSIDFYTKTQIDEKLNGVNAMVYKGTVGTGGTVSTLPTSGVKIGDTYMAAVEGTYGTHSCAPGDLLIAISTDNTEENGVIPTAKLKWTYVPAGDDTDTQFALEVADNKIKLKNSTTGGDAGSATIGAGNNITVNTSGTTITVGHEGFVTDTESTTNKTLQHNNSFTAITGVTTNNGHLTKYTTTTFVMPNDNDTTFTLSGSDNQLLLKDSNSGNAGKVTVSGGTNIEATVSSNVLTVKHENMGTVAKTTPTAKDLNANGTFTAITGVVTNNGHITGYTEQTYKLPVDNDTTYTLSGASVTSITNGIKVTDTLKASTNASTTSALSVTSSSLKLTAGTNAYSIDIEWGSF